MGPYLKDYNTFNNKIPHYCGVLPKFYNNLKKILKQHSDILKLSNTKSYYKQ